MKCTRVGRVVVCVVLAAWAGTVQAGPPPPTLWISQTGTAGIEEGRGIALDPSGNIYVAGLTDLDFAGPSKGSMDAVAVKYDVGGTVQWARQIGTAGADAAYDIAVDGLGNSYIAGFTEGNLGWPNEGGADAFILKHNSGGTFQWVTQIGTPQWDRAMGVAVDGSGRTYITGRTEGSLGGPSQGGDDAFIVKHSTPGWVQWARQIGTDTWDWANDVAVDAGGNSYIAGYTVGDLAWPNYEGADAFIAKYDSGGTLQWTRQIGSSGDDGASGGIAVDGGNIYVAGYTSGDLGGPNQGDDDAFLLKCDSGGTVQWTRQIGSSSRDVARGVAVDGSGNIYITGHTDGELGGPHQGAADAFIVKYDSAGTVLWTRQIGTSAMDLSFGIAVDGGGNSYITGGTQGDLGGPHQGSLLDLFTMAIGGQSTIDGDANLDCYVDGLDYVVWSNNYKLSDQWWEEGDFTGEGYVDGLDYIIWSNNYKAGCPGHVPEPGALLLLAFGLLALIRRRKV